MAPVRVPVEALQEFVDFDAFYQWLAQNHDKAEEVWVRLFRKGSGRRSIDAAQAIDAVLCWGWIDAIRKSHDTESFVQRYCPRRPKSVWSQVNRDNVVRLEAAGLMTENGRRQVELARQDGRWDAAYRTKDAAPDDLIAAIAASARAQACYEQLSAQNRFALNFRVNALKTEAGRKKRIAAFVEMLERGETIYPQRPIVTP